MKNKTFGKIGDEVFHNTRKSKGIIISNTLNLLGNIIVKNPHGVNVTWDPKFLDIIYKENTVDKEVKNNIWEFKAQTFSLVDWDLVKSELSHSNPLALLRVKEDKCEYKYVVIHPSLLIKSTLTTVDNIIDVAGISETTIPKVYVCSKFEPVIEWARKVRQASIKSKFKAPITVNVTLLEI